jgi:hypothetical protein
MEMPNAKLVKQGLQNLAKEIPQIGRLGMLRLAQRVSAYYAYTKTNPPKYGAYVRTFAMRSARKILKETQGYVFVMNPVGPKGQMYASFVVGDLTPESQRWPFVGRWVPLRQAVQIEVAKMPPEIQKELGELVSKEAAKANAK